MVGVELKVESTIDLFTPNFEDIEEEEIKIAFREWVGKFEKDISEKISEYFLSEFDTVETNVTKIDYIDKNEIEFSYDIIEI